MDILARPTRYLFFTGKGGVGKTSLACAAAIALADRGKQVLLISTDPASNLGQALGTPLDSTPRAIPGVPGLHALDIDPNVAADAYRERALAPLLGQADEAEIARRREDLSGACTVEIAAFDEFTRFLAGPQQPDAYDHIVFDTAPTGHTLRLLALPAAWADYIDDNPLRSTGCLGPSHALRQNAVQYREAVEALGDPAQTTIALVARPERSALAEAARTAAELRELGMRNQRLLINGVFHPTDPGDPIAAALASRGDAALRAMPAALRELPAQEIALQPVDLVGIDRLRRLLTGGIPLDPDLARAQPPIDLPPVAALVDDLAAPGHGAILVMGKGGVGKTTIAAAIAVELAARGHETVLTTTDPAAHLARTVEGVYPHLTVERIDPAAEVAAYTERVVATKGRGLDADGLALLREDLKSPCTEEVAVFHAFSRAISRARNAFVVIDTAPTGHTLLLLDTAGAYHHEILRSLDEQGRSGSAVTPLMRLRDPDYTRMIVVTLPETTPVQEAIDLQADLARAGITPYAWVIDSSLAAADPRDPLLRARAASEREQIARVQTQSARVHLAPWQPEEPVGIDRLRALAHGGAPVASADR